MDLSFNCNDGTDAISSSNTDGYNVCSAKLDLYQEEYEAFGSIENISVDAPIHGVTYTGQIINLSEEDGIVDYTLIFSGLDASGNTVIFDYMQGTIDPAVRNDYAWWFIYSDPSADLSNGGGASQEQLSKTQLVSLVEGEMERGISQGFGRSYSYLLTYVGYVNHNNAYYKGILYGAGVY